VALRDAALDQFAIMMPDYKFTSLFSVSIRRFDPTLCCIDPEKTPEVAPEDLARSSSVMGGYPYCICKSSGIWKFPNPRAAPRICAANQVVLQNRILLVCYSFPY